MRLHVLLLLLTTVTSSPAFAQGLPPERGETIRVIVRHPVLRSDATVTGTFDGLGRDSLYLSDRAYHRPLVRRIEVARGEQTYSLVGLAIGAGLGGVIGASLGAAEDQADLPPQGETYLWWQTGLVGVGAGALTGGIVGLFFRRTRWEWVPLDMQASLSPNGLRLSYTFPAR